MSNNRIAEYIVKIVGQNAQLMGQVNQANAGLQQMTNQANVAAKSNSALTATLKSVATAAAGAFSVASIYQFTKASINAYEESSKAQAKVAQAIKTTGGVAGMSLKELTSIAEDFQKSTLFEDDAIMNGVTAQLLTFTNIAGVNFKRAQVAALDLATVLDGDLKGTAIQLGKALNDPVAGLAALGRSGISFSAEQKAVIKNLAETNQLAAAQTLILNELERQYGGQAESAAKASNGLVRFMNALGDAQEKVGKAIVEGETFTSGLDDMTDILYTWSNENISTWKAIGISLDKALWGSHGTAFLAQQRSLEKAVDEYSRAEANAQAQGKTFTAVQVVKEESLNAVTAALTAAKEAQGEVDKSDLKAVAASNKLVTSLTLEKEAYEKLFAVQRPREKVEKLAPMEQRIDVKTVVSGKKDLTPPPTLKIKPPVTYESDTMKGYSKELDIITQKSLLYANVLDTVVANKEATQSAIDGLLNEGYAAESIEVQRLMGIMDQYSAQQSRITGMSEQTKEALATMGGSFSSLGSNIGGAAGEWMGFAGQLMTEIPNLIAQVIALTTTQVVGSGAVTAAKSVETAATVAGTTATIIDATASVAAGAAEVATSTGVMAAKTGETYMKGVASAAGLKFPLNIVAMIAMVGIVSGIIASIPKAKKFANGGIISGPTLGLMGEYPGASNNPEVVAPLSKLKGMIKDQGGASHISVDDIVITGNQLRIIQKVTNRQIGNRT